MSTVAEAVSDPLSDPAPEKTPGLAAAIDRWIWAFMAALFVVTALVGFVPDSLNKIAAVEAGQRAPFPPALHVHAVLMGSWLMLLLAQTGLMATGRRAAHMQLGLASFALMPAIVVSGIILAPTMYAGILATLEAAPPEARESMRQVQVFAHDILLFQGRAAILFPVCVLLALRARRTDPGFHKRMMIMAIVLPLPAAIGRIAWLPSTLPAAPQSNDFYMLLWIAPIFLWDLYRERRIHRAYIVFLGLNLPFIVATNLLWNSPWWQATAAGLLGGG